MLRTPLPEELPQPFTPAEARALGMTYERTRAHDLMTPFHGVRLPAALAEDRLARLRALQHLTPRAAFSHQTAARLLRLPLPVDLQRSAPVHLTVPGSSNRVERRGIVGHVADRRVVRLPNGLLITDAGDTWCDLAPSLTLEQLVQAGDPILNRAGWDLGRLAAAVDRARGRRGVRTLRQALPLLRPGSRSPRETACRLLFGTWGLPEPELNVDLYVDSGWLACVDFLWPDRRVVAEYYGEVHSPTWKDDLARAAMIEDAGYAMVVITDHDFRRQQALRARLLRLLG